MTKAGIRKKRLTDLSNEELGRLFPIVLSEPKKEWAVLFLKEEANIRRALGGQTVIRIEHIGSTAVPGLIAKPTIDILLEVPEQVNTVFLIKTMEGLGYHCIPHPENPPPHLMFARGYTMKGFRGQAYHVHIRYPGDWDEPYFRDYLRLHPETAREYAELKKEMAGKYKHDRDGYTEQKGEFIKKITSLARSEVKDKSA